MTLRKETVVSALAVSLLLYAPPVWAQQELEVKIGSPASGARHSHDHDITTEALKQGKASFTLKSSPQESHRINLTRKQVTDLLDGTTIIVNSSDGESNEGGKKHQHRVTLTVKSQEAESAGW